MLKLHFVHTICHKFDKFRSILIIFRELLNISKAYIKVGWNSAVGIATHYGLDGLGIESQWGEIFRTRPNRPWGPLSLRYRVFPGGKAAGAWR